MDDMLGNIFVRSLFAATVLFILAKAMGKKQISQLTLFDYVSGISIGSIAASASIDRRIALSDGIISMAIWGNPSAYAIIYFDPKHMGQKIA